MGRKHWRKKKGDLNDGVGGERGVWLIRERSFQSLGDKARRGNSKYASTIEGVVDSEE